MNHLRKSTVVTYTYQVEWNTMSTEDPEVIDQLLDLEDDIVSSAVFVYNVDANFGDEYTNAFVIHKYLDSDEWVIETEKDFVPTSDTKVLTDVEFHVDATQTRM
jgi:hypothetical protein